MLTRFLKPPSPVNRDKAQAALQKRALERTLRAQGISRAQAKKYVSKWPAPA